MTTHGAGLYVGRGGVERSRDLLVSGMRSRTIGGTTVRGRDLTWREADLEWEKVQARIRLVTFGACQFSSVSQSCPTTLCGPMDCSTPGFPVHHQLSELAQTHVNRVGEAIKPILCCPLLLLPSIIPSIKVFSNESVLCIR